MANLIWLIYNKRNLYGRGLIRKSDKEAVTSRAKKSLGRCTAKGHARSELVYYMKTVM